MWTDLRMSVPAAMASTMSAHSRGRAATALAPTESTLITKFWSGCVVKSLVISGLALPPCIPESSCLPSRLHGFISLLDGHPSKCASFPACILIRRGLASTICISCNLMFISFSYPSLSRMKFHLFLIIVLVRTYQATHSLWPLNLLLPTYAL